MKLINTKIKVAKKYQPMLETIDNEGRGSGLWAYSKKGFHFAGMGGECHTAHEYNQKDLMEMIRTLEPCECHQCKTEDESEPEKKSTDQNNIQSQLETALKLIEKLTIELDDSVDFFNTFDGFPEGIGCTCDEYDLDSDDCICVSEDGEVKRVTDKVDVLEEARQFMKTQSIGVEHVPQ